MPVPFKRTSSKLLFAPMSGPFVTDVSLFDAFTDCVDITSTTREASFNLADMPPALDHPIVSNDQALHLAAHMLQAT